MSNIANTPETIVDATPTATLKMTRTQVAANFSGSPKSPNLPHGEWEFVADTEGNVEAASDTSAKGTEYKYFEVRPKGNPDGQARRVYPAAMTAVSAEKVLYDKDGNLKRSATFGVFTQTVGEVRTTVVSTSAKEVADGTAKANAAYQKQRATAELAATAA
jgi:hypothetical protein